MCVLLWDGARRSAHDAGAHLFVVEGDVPEQVRT
jgi:hypothetical protein